VEEVLGLVGGMAILQTGLDIAAGPWVGLAMFAGYTAVLLGVAGYVLRRRDA
jgi:hypothetical protein